MNKFFKLMAGISEIRLVRPIYAALSGKATRDDTYRGVDWWVTNIVGRIVTFKDIGRRVVMTKLANDPTMSGVDAAKYLGVKEQI